MPDRRPSLALPSAAGSPADAATTAPSHSEVIRQSHRRSAALGLTRSERLAIGPMLRSDLRVALERNQRLCAHAAPVMQVLFEQIVNTDSMIVLTDASGTILHTVGDDGFLARASKVALAPGENWAEHAKGTNAIGTALFEERPTLVHASEHFIHANNFLTCSAAPIFDPRGNVLGVLDVTGDQRSYHQHTMGLVRMSARMIENHWLTDDFHHGLRLHFHLRPAFIGTLLEGIVAVGADGRLLGANRSALDQLGLANGSALRAHTLRSLFGTDVAALHDHFRSPVAAPLRLVLSGGQPVHVMARLDWSSSVSSSGLVDAEAPPPAAPSAAPPRPMTAAVAPGLPVLRALPPPATEAAADGLHALCTGDAVVAALVQKLRRALDHDIPLLLSGEAGTGKEVVARAVHHDSARTERAFVVVDCAASSEAQIEATLFGRPPSSGRHGRRHAASAGPVLGQGGTVYLDHIDALPAALQARLLQALQARSFTPPHGTQAVATDVAVVAASRQPLRESVQRGAFRDDLYRHLSGLALRWPALRDRSDLAALAQRLLQALRPADTPELSPAVMDLFQRYGWPGNVRQLAQVLRTAAVMSAGEGRIAPAHLSDDFLDEARQAPSASAHADAGSDAAADGMGTASPPEADRPQVLEATTLHEAEVELIRKTLQALGGNVSATSKRLGISRNTIYRKLRANAGA